jgi:hypothetical protein
VSRRRGSGRRPRPGAVCAALLSALEASEGRSQRRKRDQTPDRIGLAIKRSLLERAVEADPAPDAFEGWLLEQCLADTERAGVGPTRAMALEILAEWRLAERLAPFGAWLAQGAPSEDAETARTDRRGV